MPETTSAEHHESPPGRWLTRGVASIGLASFFSDSGHEIATSVLPTFVTSTLHGSAGALGLIEGLSDGLTGIAKLTGGPLANDPARRSRLASGGYLATAAATGALGLAGSVWQAGMLRALAWASRGIRSPARDSLMASLARPDAQGRAFGVERAGDNAGAIVGPLLAAALVASIGVRHTLYLSAVPGLFAAIAITVAAREAKLGDAGRRRARLELNRLRQVGILPALIPVLAFELGNIATTLLILRATDLLHHGGRSIADATAVAILVYVGHNVAATIFAVVGGRWIDRTNPRRAFTAGAGIYIASYALFALTLRSWGMLLVAFVLAGAAIGFAETAESTLVAQLLPDELRGSGFGLLGALQAAGDLGSSAVAGLIWTLTSPSWAFAYAAAWMVVSVAAAGLVRAWSKPDSG